MGHTTKISETIEFGQKKLKLFRSSFPIKGCGNKKIIQRKLLASLNFSLFEKVKKRSYYLFKKITSLSKKTFNFRDSITQKIQRPDYTTHFSICFKVSNIKVCSVMPKLLAFNNKKHQK